MYSVMYLPGGLWGLDPHSYINISLKLTYEHVKNTPKKSSDPHSSFFYKYITGCIHCFTETFITPADQFLGLQLKKTKRLNAKNLCLKSESIFKSMPKKKRDKK